MGKKNASRIAGLSSSQRIQKRLVENITLLWAMCEVPDLPKENRLRESYDKRRQLSLDREKQLVDYFAFISATTNDPLRIMAVCVEEDGDEKGMTIRLASNTGDLSSVVQGFMGIARTLEKASSKSRSRSEIRQELFRQIVGLDEPRILSRLRSRHAARNWNKKEQRELLPLLRETIQDNSINERGEMMKTSLSSLRSCSKQLSTSFSEFEVARGEGLTKNASRDMLIDLLMQIKDLDVDSLDKALRLSPIIDPSLKYFLPRAINKISRYHHISCDLVDAARSPQYTLFQRISIQAIPKHQLDMAFLADQSANFEETFRRVTGSSHQYRHSDFDPRVVSAVRTRFLKRMTDRATKWKVHAEVQILLFYEQRPQLFRPRIIGSSKSACYLCNLFIQSHGQFQVSRSHGRLYDRWILPTWPLDQASAEGNVQSAVDKLNSALETKIISVLNDRQRPFAHPAESVLIFRQPWSPNPTLSSISRQEAQAVHENIEPNSIGPSENPAESSPTTSLYSFRTSIDRKDIAPSLAADATPVQRPPQLPITTIRHLYQGESTSCKLTQKSDAFVVETDFGTIYTSWDFPSEGDAENTHSPSDCACWIQVTSLARNTQVDQAVESFKDIDAHSMTPGQDYVFEHGSALSSKELTLQLKGHTLLIKYSFGDLESHDPSKIRLGESHSGTANG
ncbi:hypothetical protein XANCAGTX0491_006088 [Xanthoria calcicola]